MRAHFDSKSKLLIWDLRKAGGMQENRVVSVLPY
jgi:hypothetical protein